MRRTTATYRYCTRTCQMCLLSLSTAHHTEPRDAQVVRCMNCGSRNYIPGAFDPVEDDDREAIAPGDEHYYRPPGAADR